MDLTSPYETWRSERRSLVQVTDALQNRRFWRRGRVGSGGCPALLFGEKPKVFRQSSGFVRFASFLALRSKLRKAHRVWAAANKIRLTHNFYCFILADDKTVNI